MRFRANRLVLGVVFLGATTIAQASIVTRPTEGHAPAAGRQLSEEKQRQLQQALRRITGDDALRFGADGRLLLGAGAPPTRGSATAFRILREAALSRALFLVEDHSDSPDIHFGQLDEGLIYENIHTKSRFTVWRLRLDFADFQRMEASPQVRQTFDVGFTMLHELLHGAGLRDPAKRGEIGPCETIINRARAELGLPQRERYHGDPVPIAPGLLTVRMRFKAREASWPRSKWQYLFFLIRTAPSSGDADPPSRPATVDAAP